MKAAWLADAVARLDHKKKTERRQHRGTGSQGKAKAETKKGTKEKQLMFAQ